MAILKESDVSSGFTDVSNAINSRRFNSCLVTDSLFLCCGCTGSVNAAMFSSARFIYIPRLLAAQFPMVDSALCAAAPQLLPSALFCSRGRCGLWPQPALPVPLCAAYSPVAAVVLSAFSGLPDSIVQSSVPCGIPPEARAGDSGAETPLQQVSSSSSAGCLIPDSGK